MRSLILTAAERPAEYVDRDVSGKFQVPDDIHLGDSEEPERTRTVRPMTELVIEPGDAEAAEGKAGEDGSVG